MAYHIILGAGQSNCAGKGIGPFTDTFASYDSKILQLGRHTNDMQLMPVGIVSGGVKWDNIQDFTSAGANMGPLLPLARRYAKYKLPAGDRVVIVGCSYGGTSIAQWLGEAQPPAGAPNGLFRDTLDRVRHVMNMHGTNKLVALVFCQGEAELKDAQPGDGSADAYRANRVKLINRWRARFTEPDGSPGRWVTLTGTFLSGTYNHKPIQKAEYTQAITDAADEDGRTGVIEMTDMLSNDEVVGDGDTVHWSAAAHIMFGHRAYQAGSAAGFAQPV